MISDSTTEIVSAADVTAADLRAITECINDHIGLISQHEQAFQEATLEPRLIIGMQVCRAQQLFTLTHSEAGGLKGRTESLSRVTSFSDWLTNEIPLLKRPHAYKLATAFRGLGLPLDSKPRAITESVKKLRHEAGKAGQPMPSVESLYKAGKPPKDAPMPPLLPTPPEDLAGEGRVLLHEWMTLWDNIVKTGSLEPLNAADLRPVHDFVTTVRDHLTARIKSSR